MGNFAPTPLAAYKKPQGISKHRNRTHKKASEEEQRWLAQFLSQYDKLFASVAMFNESPRNGRHEEQAAFMIAFQEHMNSHCYYEWFVTLSAIEPHRKMPEWFLEKRSQSPMIKKEAEDAEKKDKNAAE